MCRRLLKCSHLQPAKRLSLGGESKSKRERDKWQWNARFACNIRKLDRHFLNFHLVPSTTVPCRDGKVMGRSHCNLYVRPFSLSLPLVSSTSKRSVIHNRDPTDISLPAAIYPLLDFEKSHWSRQIAPKKSTTPTTSATCTSLPSAPLEIPIVGCRWRTRRNQWHKFWIIMRALNSKHVAFDN